jgi:hypothetical protein
MPPVEEKAHDKAEIRFANRPWLFALPFFLFLAAQCVYFAWSTGPTLDEPFYIARGPLALKYQMYGLSMEAPPLAPQLGTLPMLLMNFKFPFEKILYLPDPNLPDFSLTGSAFLFKSGNPPYLMLFFARLPIIAITLLLAFFVYRWSYELYGLGGGLLSLSLLSLCPNVIAHGSLFTTDMAGATFMFLGIFSLNRLFKSNRPRDAVWTGVFCGLALVSKLNTALLFPILFSLFAVYALLEGRKAKAIDFSQWNRPLAAAAFSLLALTVSHRQSGIMFGPACMVLIGFCFFEKGLPPQRAKRIFFLLLYTAGWIACWVPLLAASKKASFSVRGAFSIWLMLLLFLNIAALKIKNAEWLKGLLKAHSLIWVIAAFIIVFDHTDFTRTMLRWKPFGQFIGSLNAVISHTQGHHVICVSNSFITCDWRYFTASLVAKTPSLTLTLFVAGLAGLLLLRTSLIKKICLMLPPFAYLFVASFLNKLNIGLRHVLPVFPYLFVIAGGAVLLLNKIRNTTLKSTACTIVAGLWLLTAGRNLSIYPDYLSYFTEWVGDAYQGALLTADSNIDWGQNNRRMLELIQQLGIKKITMAVTASNDAEYDYAGIEWERRSPYDLKNPAPGYYVLDLPAYIWHQSPGAKDSFFQNRKPDYTAGRTLYLFKV